MRRDWQVVLCRSSDYEAEGLRKLGLRRNDGVGIKKIEKKEK